MTALLTVTLVNNRYKDAVLMGRLESAVYICVKRIGVCVSLDETVLKLNYKMNGGVCRNLVVCKTLLNVFQSQTLSCLFTVHHVSRFR